MDDADTKSAFLADPFGVARQGERLPHRVPLAVGVLRVSPEMPDVTVFDRGENRLRRRKEHRDQFKNPLNDLFFGHDVGHPADEV